MKTYLQLILCIVLTVSCNAQSTPELANLKSLRDSAVDKIDRAYIQQVRELKERYTKAGKLTEAMECEAILSELDSNARDYPKQWLIGSKWKSEKSGKIFTFSDTSFTNKISAYTWSKNGNEITVAIPGEPLKLRLNQEANSLQELNKEKVRWMRVD